MVKSDISFEESSSEGKGDDDEQDVCNYIYSSAGSFSGWKISFSVTIEWVVKRLPLCHRHRLLMSVIMAKIRCEQTYCERLTYP